jgi:hypothetical protein
LEANRQNEPPPNVILGKREGEDTVRPDWVPPNAQWVSGIWYVSGHRVFDTSVRPIPPEIHRAQQIEANRVAQEKLVEGLPPGYYRQGGIIYNPRGQKAIRDPLLPGGYSDDGSYRPGHAEKLAARIARIQEAAAERKAAIAEFEQAKLRMEKAEARFHKSYETEE